MHLLVGEVTELIEVCRKGSDEEIIAEAVDVARFAFFIAAKLEDGHERELDQPE